jgi:hypothetical protein
MTQRAGGWRGRHPDKKFLVKHGVVLKATDSSVILTKNSRRGRVIELRNC